jgi:hypothetical protein
MPKFIAGTESRPMPPRGFISPAKFSSEATTSFRMQWTVVTNRLYQVNVSTNLVKLADRSPRWLQASNNPTMNYIVTNSGSRFAFLPGSSASLKAFSKKE